MTERKIYCRFPLTVELLQCKLNSDNFSVLFFSGHVAANNYHIVIIIILIKNNNIKGSVNFS